MEYSLTAKISEISTTMLPKMKRLACSDIYLENLVIDSAPELRHR
jgi:hypothetical protein